MVLGIGGNLITSDITHGLSLSLEQAEKVKIEHGYSIRSEVDEDDVFQIRLYDSIGLVEYELGFEPLGLLVRGNIKVREHRMPRR